MPSCEVLRAVKIGGVRHPPGTVVDLTDDQLAGLPPGVVRAQTPPPAAASGPPRAPKTEAEKQDAVKQAQERVARTTKG